MGLCHVRAALLLGDVARAETLFARGAASRPRDARIRVDWGLALEQLGRQREALERYREALAIDGDDTEALNGLAFLLASRPGVSGDRTTDATEAVRLARRACAVTDHADPAIVDTLATALAAAGDYGAAVEAADRAVALAEETGDEPLVAEIRAHRDLFRAGRPLAPEN